MKKETFILAIEAIKKQTILDVEFSKHLGKAFKNAHQGNLMPDNHVLMNILINILQEEMNDLNYDDAWIGWIEWYCFENDFGRSGCKIKEADGSVIIINNASDLYYFMMKNKNENERK